MPKQVSKGEYSLQQTVLDGPTDTDDKRMVLKGKGEGGINQESASSGDTLLCIKQMMSEGLLYSTGDYTQYLVITYNGKESEKEF